MPSPSYQEEIEQMHTDELLVRFFETPEERVYTVIEYLQRKENPDVHALSELESIHRRFVWERVIRNE